MASTQTSPLLFTEYSLRSVRIKNRIMASPMWQYAARDWRPTDWHLMHLGRLAAGGAGLVFQEGTTVERRGCGTTGDLGIWNDDFVPQLRRLAAVIEDNGSVAGIQLMHAGRKGRQRMPFDGRGPLAFTPEIRDWDQWDLVAPSAIPAAEGYPTPRALTLAEISDVQQAFVDATRRAAEAGYRVLNLHGAHGYLLHEFMSPASNRRTDRYGGTFANRIRFALETFEAIRAEWPADLPIMMRISALDHEWSIEDSVALVRELKALGIDMIDCSSGGLKGSPLPPGHALTPGYQVPFAQHIRRETGVPTSAVGLIVHAQQAEQVLSSECADLVAIGRELIMNPNWPIDAEMKLTGSQDYSAASMPTRFWLARRAESVPGLLPSTMDRPFPAQDEA